MNPSKDVFVYHVITSHTLGLLMMCAVQIYSCCVSYQICSDNICVPAILLWEKSNIEDTCSIMIHKDKVYCDNAVVIRCVYYRDTGRRVGCLCVAGWVLEACTRGPGSCGGAVWTCGHKITGQCLPRPQGLPLFQVMRTVWSRHSVLDSIDWMVGSLSELVIQTALQTMWD